MTVVCSIELRKKTERQPEKRGQRGNIKEEVSSTSPTLPGTQIDSLLISPHLSSLSPASLLLLVRKTNKLSPRYELKFPFSVPNQMYRFILSSIPHVHIILSGEMRKRDFPFTLRRRIIKHNWQLPLFFHHPASLLLLRDHHHHQRQRLGFVSLDKGANTITSQPSSSFSLITN